MKCPRCHSENAYTGLQWIHCVNVDCYYFDEQYAQDVLNELMSSDDIFADDDDDALFTSHIDGKAARLIAIREMLDLD